MIQIRKETCGRISGTSKRNKTVVNIFKGLFVKELPGLFPSGRKLNKCNRTMITPDMFFCILLGLVTFASYYNSLGGEFVHDDISAITTNKDVLGQTPLLSLLTDDYWGQRLNSPNSHKSHRPLTTLTFRLNAAIHDELNNVGYHLVNVGLHVIVVLTLYYLCRISLLWNPNKSALTALLFGIHPVHTEAVSNIVGRADILATLFFVLAILSHTQGTYCDSSKTLLSRTWYFISVMFAIMSFLSKEQGICSFIFLVIYESISDSSPPFHENRKPSKLVLFRFLRTKLKMRNLCLLAVAGLLLFVRIILMGIQLPKFSEEDNPAAFSKSFKTRTLTYSFLPSYNCWLLLAPVTLSYDWQIGSVPLVESFVDYRNLGTISILTFLIAFGYHFLTVEQVQEKRLMCLGFILPVLAFLPATNLMFHVGFVIAERFLYLPSVGFCILVSHGMHKLSTSSYFSQGRKLRFTIHAFVFVLIISSVVRTYKRNIDWSSRHNLFLSGVRDFPHNAKMHYNYGNLLKDQGDLVGAERHYRKALEQWPYYASAHNNLGTIVNDVAEASFHFHQAIRYNPGHSRAYYNLALIYSKRNLTNSAIKLLETSILLDDTLTEAHSKLASLLFIVARFKETEVLHRKIIKRWSENADICNNYGVLLEETGRSKEAIKYYKMTIDRNPSHVYGLMNVCRLLSAQGRLLEAKYLYEQFLKSNPLQPDVADGLGTLLIKLNRFEEASQLYKDLIRAVPNCSSARLHYAQILMNQRNYIRAEEQLLSIINSTSVNDKIVLYHIANLYERTNRTTEALEHVLMAIDDCDNDSELCANLYILHGDIMKHLKYYDEAAQSYKIALAMKSDLYQVHVNLGAIYHIQSEYEQAWQHYLAAKVLQPTHPVILENIAKLERAQMSILHCKDSAVDRCW